MFPRPISAWSARPSAVNGAKEVPAVGMSSDPYSGDTIVEIKLATRQDVDAAYGAAKSAQRGWRNRLPDERAQAMYRAAAIIDERREEITSWLVRESGSTRIASLMS